MNSPTTVHMVNNETKRGYGSIGVVYRSDGKRDSPLKAQNVDPLSQLLAFTTVACTNDQLKKKSDKYYKNMPIQINQSTENINSVVPKSINNG